MNKPLAILIASLVAIAAFSLTVFIFGKNLGKGALQVTSDPASKVYLDGKLIGQTPLCKCELSQMLSSGEYSIKLIPTEGNSNPFETKLKIEPKVLTVVDGTFSDDGPSASVITLSKLSDKNDAEVQVSSFPADAQVFLDSGQVGQSPILQKNVTESDHEIKLIKKGYKDKIVRIRTVKGYKLETLVFLGINPQDITNISSPSASISVQKVLILDTPTGFLRVRSDPSLGGSQVGQVLPGGKYDLLNEQTGWFKIKVSDQIQGWISSQYAEKL
ncbi:MAG TPA: PEGA domain-containing protein [Patescibacteria group bacterium]|nr:PEGA domain-containing protein [Patescibacteria group bacterium]